MNGQESTKFSRRGANFSANRTTEELKVRFSGSIRESKSEFDAGDETIESPTNSERLTGQIVKSIGGQWAVGSTTN